ncbi:MAG TPA: hypothetical protein VIV14_11675 [Gammaproteobacteria bacterium]
MKSVVLAFSLAGILAASACTTLEPTEATPEELQRLILSEQLLEPGERVRIVTADETVHEFRIADIDVLQRLVIGDDLTVPVDEIVAVDTREVSIGRTALLAGGLAYGIGAIIAVAIAPAVLLGGL